MANMLADGVTMLKTAEQANMAVTVTFSRPSTGVTSAPTAATPGESRISVTEPSTGVKIVQAAKDYIIPASLYLLGAGNTLTTPQRGDQVVEVTPDGVTRTYQCLPFGGDDYGYRYSDPERTLLRIHYKAIKGGA